MKGLTKAVMRFVFSQFPLIILIIFPKDPAHGHVKSGHVEAYEFPLIPSLTIDVRTALHFQVQWIKTLTNSIAASLQSKDPPIKSSKMPLNSANM